MTVSILDQVLWIGPDAYPIRNIARTQKIVLAPDRTKALLRYMAAVILSVACGVAAKLGLDAAYAHATSLDARRAISRITPEAPAIAVMILVAVATIRVVAVLLGRTYYVLVVETAGTPHAALASTDRMEIDTVVVGIMQALNNPRTELSMKIENVHVGDKIEQRGDYNIGKGSR